MSAANAAPGASAAPAPTFSARGRWCGVRNAIRFRRMTPQTIVLAVAVALVALVLTGCGSGGADAGSGGGDSLTMSPPYDGPWSAADQGTFMGGCSDGTN